MTTHCSSKRGVIYGLVDPRDGALRYVGKTTNLRIRLNGHMCGPGQTYRERWVRLLRGSGLRPSVVVLENDVAATELASIERWWILLCRLAGCHMVNVTDGGEGTIGRRNSSEARQKMSAAQKGRPKTIEHRTALRAAHSTPELIERARATMSRLVATPEYRASLSRAMMGHVVTPETRAKISATLKARYGASLPVPAAPREA